MNCSGITPERSTEMLREVDFDGSGNVRSSPSSDFSKIVLSQTVVAAPLIAAWRWRGYWAWVEQPSSAFSQVLTGQKRHNIDCSGICSNRTSEKLNTVDTTGTEAVQPSQAFGHRKSATASTVVASPLISAWRWQGSKTLDTLSWSGLLQHPIATKMARTVTVVALFSVVLSRSGPPALMCRWGKIGRISPLMCYLYVLRATICYYCAPCFFHLLSFFGRPH